MLSREDKRLAPGNGPTITTFVFQVRNIPAALYKAMGGFATNGVNMTKLESYMIEGNFFATQFYADVEGHPDDHNLTLALEELAFFSTHFKVLGVYPANPFRATNKRMGEGGRASRMPEGVRLAHPKRGRETPPLPTYDPHPPRNDRRRRSHRERARPGLARDLPGPHPRQHPGGTVGRTARAGVVADAERRPAGAGGRRGGTGGQDRRIRIGARGA